MGTNTRVITGVVIGLVATFGSACSKPLEVEADARAQAEKWAAGQGWVPTTVKCEPRPEKRAGLWSCYATRVMPRVSAALWCDGAGCTQF